VGIYKKKGLERTIELRIFSQMRCVYNKSVAFYTMLCI